MVGESECKIPCLMRCFGNDLSQIGNTLRRFENRARSTAAFSFRD